MAKRLIFLCDYKVEKIISNALSVERIGDSFVVLIPDKLNVSKTNIREAVKALKDQDLAIKIVKVFLMPRVTEKCAKRIFPNLRVVNYSNKIPNKEVKNE